MRKHKIVRVITKKFGKCWENYALSEKLVIVKLPRDQTIRALLAAGQFIKALSLIVDTNRFFEAQIPISAAMASKKKWEWKGDWSKPEIFYTPVTPRR